VNIRLRVSEQTLRVRGSKFNGNGEVSGAGFGISSFVWIWS